MHEIIKVDKKESDLKTLFYVPLFKFFKELLFRNENSLQGKNKINYM